MWDFIGAIATVLVTGVGFLFLMPKTIDWLTEQIMKIRWVKK